jgi:glycosyltransferase involved in cell wall biosynthesis
LAIRHDGVADGHGEVVVRVRQETRRGNGSAIWGRSELMMQQLTHTRGSRVGATTPAVSVTIISYNQAHYLVHAIDSALAQDFREFEIVVSDDASTDESSSVLKRYRSRYPDRVRAIFNDRNIGLAANRDRAMRACRGEFIAWLDADDMWQPDKLSRQVAFMRSRPLCSLGYHNMLLLNDDALTQDRYINPPVPPAEENYENLIRCENYIPSSSVMIRASVLNGQGYHFGGRRTFSDFHFFVRMAAIGQLAYLADCLGAYRRHPGSAMRTAQRVSSCVRKRREQALRSMLEEFPQSRDLVRYALARFYISQLIGAVRQIEPLVGIAATRALISLMPQALDAARDRKRNLNLLGGFKY